MGVVDEVEGEDVFGELLLGFLHFEFVDEREQGLDLLELLYGEFGFGLLLLQWLQRVERKLWPVFELGAFSKR